MALHPQIDLATEPRWSRQVATFGEDAELSGAWARPTSAASRATSRPGLGATMTKHFPGGGPQQDGEDPHFAYGREQVYPGGNSTSTCSRSRPRSRRAPQMMPYYGMPVGTEYEEVGFGFNQSVITGLLRERSASTASSAPTGA